jgi:hypothetical protein
VEKKLSTFHHAHEVAPHFRSWYHNVWQPWEIGLFVDTEEVGKGKVHTHNTGRADAEASTTSAEAVLQSVLDLDLNNLTPSAQWHPFVDVHPTHAPAYKNLVVQTFLRMPQQLRRMLARWMRVCRSVPLVTKWSPRQFMMCGSMRHRSSLLRSSEAQLTVDELWFADTTDSSAAAAHKQQKLPPPANVALFDTYSFVVFTLDGIALYPQHPQVRPLVASHFFPAANARMASGSNGTTLGTTSPLHFPLGCYDPKLTLQAWDAEIARTREVRYYLLHEEATHFQLADSSIPAVGCPFQVALLIIGEGTFDVYTSGVFADIASTLVSALTNLGIPNVLLYCKDLRKCQIHTFRQYIILAPQNLARYFDANDELAVVSTGWPPRSSILYNFEHISRGHTYGNDTWNTVNAHVMHIYQHFDEIWDFDANNVHALQLNGVPAAVHVPFAFSEGVYFTNEGNDTKTKCTVTPDVDESAFIAQTSVGTNETAGCSEADGDVDILFYGRVNAYRRSMVASLQKKGLRVLYANINGDSVFGERLHCLTLQAKIILNLRYFNEDEEWKLSRILPLLANKRFVVSETSGSPSEVARYQNGVIFVAPGDHGELARTCLYYLNKPSERKLVAQKGHAIATAIRMEDILRPLLRERACRAGCCVPGTPGG